MYLADLQVPHGVVGIHIALIEPLLFLVFEEMENLKMINL